MFKLVYFNSKKNQVLGFSAFLDYPQQDYKICDDFKWEEWIKTIKNDKIEGCTPINRLVNF